MHGCIILLKKSSQRIESNFSLSCSMYIAQCILHSYNTRKGKNVIRILSHLCPNIPYHLVAICIDLFQPPVTIIRIVLNMASRGKRLCLQKTFYYVHFNLVFLDFRLWISPRMARRVERGRRARQLTHFNRRFRYQGFLSQRRKRHLCHLQ